MIFCSALPTQLGNMSHMAAFQGLHAGAGCLRACGPGRSGDSIRVLRTSLAPCVVVTGWLPSGHETQASPSGERRGAVGKLGVAPGARDCSGELARVASRASERGLVAAGSGPVRAG